MKLQDLIKECQKLSESHGPDVEVNICVGGKYGPVERIRATVEVRDRKGFLHVPGPNTWDLSDHQRRIILFE